MSLCPVCRKLYCDHTPEERDQTPAEMMAPLTKEEKQEWQGATGDQLIDSISRDPELVKTIDWKAMNNKIVGHTKTLEMFPDGTFEITSKIKKYS